MKTSFVTIATFQYSSEALVVQGKLESENVETFLVDEYTVDTDPLVSNAIGGVKLQVHVNEFKKAEMLLKELDIHILNEQMCCPSCMSSNIQIRWSIKTILQKLFPFNGLYEYVCLECQYNFKSKEEL